MEVPGGESEWADNTWGTGSEVGIGQAPAQWKRPRNRAQGSQGRNPNREEPPQELEEKREA